MPTSSTTTMTREMSQVTASCSPSSSIIQPRNSQNPVYLTLLFASNGKRTRICIPNDQFTISQVKQIVYQSWPETDSNQTTPPNHSTTQSSSQLSTSSWPPRPNDVECIRILHLGHILEHGTLADRRIPSTPITSNDPRAPVRSTVVHILIRQRSDSGKEREIDSE